jgi:hypothetical protein
MPATAQNVYDETVQALTPNERLRLATLILNELVQQDLPAIEIDDSWTKQDRCDIMDFSLQYAVSSFLDEEYA